MNDVAFVHMTLAVVSLQTKERINALLERNGNIRMKSCTPRRDRSVEEDEIGVRATKRMKRMN